MNEQLLDILTREGVLINVSVRYWRATKKLKPEDLGLNPDTVTKRLISLGHKKLVPKERFERFSLIEGRAHSLVEANSFPFLNGLSHFLPNAKLEGVTSGLRQQEGEFNQAKLDLLSQYTELRAEALREWEEVARGLVRDPERLVETIKASFPDRERMERYFGFHTQLFQITVPEGLNLDLIDIGSQREIIQAREEAAQEAASRINRDVNRFVSDCVASLREETGKLCEEMLESIKTGKTGIHQKTLNRLIRFIDQFKDLNFAGDQVMEEHLERVRQEFLLKTAEEYRDDEFASSRLKEGLRNLGETARELARKDSQEIVEQFGRLGQRKFHMIA